MNSTQLKKLEVTGGAPMLLSAATLPFGISWTRDRTILFGQAAGVMRVSEDGGAATLIVPAREGEQIYGPQLLPGGRAVLFSVTTKQGPNRWDEAQVVVEDLSSHTRSVIVERGSDPRYLKTGHVVYALGDGLYGVRFDVSRLRATSGPVALVQGVQRPVGVVAAAAHYDISDDGTLVYIARSASSNSLVWVNRDGTDVRTLATVPPGSYQDPRLSPDGRRVLVTQSNDIWVYDIASGRKRPYYERRHQPDGCLEFGRLANRVFVGAEGESGGMGLFRGRQQRATPVDHARRTGSRRRVVRRRARPSRCIVIHPRGPSTCTCWRWTVPARVRKCSFLVKLATRALSFSRDRQYVSYLSPETGRREIYIRPYQKPGPRVTASVGGGREPVWARNGELFYRSLDGEKMFSVSVRTAP